MRRDSGHRQRRALSCCCQIDGSHTGEMLKTVVDDVVERWRCFGRVFGIASDGAANILKAVRELHQDDVIEEGQRCVCHNMHLVVSDALDDDDVKPLITKVRAIANLFKNSQVFRDALGNAQRDRHTAQQAAAPLVEVEKSLDTLGDLILEPASVHAWRPDPRAGKRTKGEEGVDGLRHALVSQLHPSTHHCNSDLLVGHSYYTGGAAGACLHGCVNFARTSPPS